MVHHKCKFLLIESNDFDYINGIIVDKAKEYIEKNIDSQWMRRVLIIDDDLDDVAKEIITMLKYNPITKAYYIDFESFDTSLYDIFVGYAKIHKSNKNQYSWITV